MTDVLDGVRDHYRATGLTERLKMALAAVGPEDQLLTPQQLGALDQFHTRGLAATAELAKLAGITADMSVLDIGSGVGGPARFLAASYGCRVTGVDLSEPFVDSARYLTERMGQSRQVSFQTASAGASIRRWPFQRRAAAACGDEHLRPGTALPRDPTRAEVRRQVCDLRHRLERWGAALSCPLGANAGNELSLGGPRDARGRRTSRFPHADMARRHRGRQGLDRPAARVGAAACAKSQHRDGAGLRAAFRQLGPKSHGGPARHPDRGVRGRVNQRLMATWE